MSYIRFACVITLGLIAGSATAQRPTIDLYIELGQVLCNAVDKNNVWVVTNGRDEAFKAQWVSDCTWVRKNVETVYLDIAYFSLRLGPVGRTRCRRARPIGDREIKVEFGARGKEPSHVIAIDSPTVDYVREVEAVQREDVRCIEEGRIPGHVSNLQADIENVRLQIFEQKRVACGVILEDLDPVVKAKTGAEFDLTREHVSWGVEKQDLKGKSCYAPTFTPLEAIERRLPKNKFPFKITVH